ncbi:hypothetical protein H0H93_008348 [Arthromyces matolae]|nr:hypothetical protein H0H93_008348 [Arthromyces matolae]
MADTPAESLESSSTTSHSTDQTKSEAKVQTHPTFKVYKPATITSPASPQSLPDEYFEPTAADLKAAQSTLSARTQALVNAPLELRAVREAREQSKRDRYPTTTIRIRFSDRTQLECTFPSTDKIRSVYAFVRNSLREDAKPIKFVLYQPPKREIKVSDPQVKDLSLAQLQLAPSSVLLLRFLDDSLNASTVPAPLLSTMLAEAIDLPPPPSFDVSPPGREPPSKTSVRPTASNLEKKIPKWLKIGSKK